MVKQHSESDMCMREKNSHLPKYGSLNGPRLWCRCSLHDILFPPQLFSPSPHIDTNKKKAHSLIFMMQIRRLGGMCDKHMKMLNIFLSPLPFHGKIVKGSGSFLFSKTRILRLYWFIFICGVCGPEPNGCLILFSGLHSNVKRINKKECFRMFIFLSGAGSMLAAIFLPFGSSSAIAWCFHKTVGAKEGKTSF